MAEHPTCPVCASPLVPVVYGMPADPEVLEAALADGLLDHRGCVVPEGPSEDWPHGTCRRCGLDVTRSGRTVPHRSDRG